LYTSHEFSSTSASFYVHLAQIQTPLFGISARFSRLSQQNDHIGAL